MRFLKSVLRMHPFMLLAAVSLLPPASLWLWREAFRVGRPEQAIREEVDKYLEPLSAAILTQLNGDVGRKALPDRIVDGVVQPVVAAAQAELRHGVDLAGGKVDDIRHDLDGQLSATRGSLLIVAGRADARLEAMQSTLDRVQQGLSPVLLNAATLEANYAALPDRVAGSQAWRKLEPEITCREADGTGYGGCWHSSITGILGEAKRSGAVFTQHFPELADSITGIAASVRKIVDFVAPKPLVGFWAHLKAVVKTAGEMLLAWIRGGGSL